MTIRKSLAKILVGSENAPICLLRSAYDIRSGCPTCIRTLSIEIWWRFGRQHLWWMSWESREWRFRAPTSIHGAKKTLGRHHGLMAPLLLRPGEGAVAEDLRLHGSKAPPVPSIPGGRRPRRKGAFCAHGGHVPMFLPLKKAYFSTIGYRDGTNNGWKAKLCQNVSQEKNEATCKYIGLVLSKCQDQSK